MKRKQEAERLAKEQDALEEQRRKLLEEADLDVSEDDLDATQSLGLPNEVFDKMEFNSEVPSLPSAFTLEGHSSPHREVQSKSHCGDNMQSTPKVGVVDPANKTPISTFQGKKQVNFAT